MNPDAKPAATHGRRRFDLLLVDLSTLFASLSATDFESGMPQGLALVREFVGADRGAIFEFSADRSLLRVTHSSIGPGVPPLTATLSANDLAWLTRRLIEKTSTVVTRVEELPDAAVGERAYFRVNGTRSSVLVPLAAGGVVLGALEFSTMRDGPAPGAWTTRRLPLIADMFSQALLRARSEVVMRQQRDELARVARLVTVGELTFTLAHELSQPLTAIMSNAQAARRFLCASEPDLDEVREALADIIDDNRRAAEVIARLRGLLSRAARTVSRFQLNDVVREVVALLREDALKAGISVTLELDGDLPSADGERVALQQVLLNLVMNAFDVLREAKDDRRELMVRTVANRAGTITVSLCDTGSGYVDDAMLERLFEPFFSTKPDGLGVGLRVCRSIIDDHGGRLWATRNPDRGLTFQFTLPAT